MKSAVTLPAWCQLKPVPVPDRGIFLLTGDDWAPTLCAHIEAAQESISLAQYSISTRWDSRPAAAGNVLAALLAARARGVLCRAVLARHKPGGSTPFFNEAAADKLTAAEWMLRRTRPARLLHAKLCIVDRYAVFMGSHNLTKSAAETNIDLSTLMLGADTGRFFSLWFEKLWGEHG